jgi:hypothetical protein
MSQNTCTYSTVEENFSSTVEYVRRHYRKYNIVCEKATDNPGKTFWNMISIYPEFVPRCKKCIEDTERFKTYPQSLYHFENNRTEGMKCSKYCLWYEWDHNRRVEINK